MYGKWSQWKPVPDLPGKMYTEKLIDGYDGLEITLKARDDSRGIKISFPYLVISYQSTEEGNRYKTLIFLEKKYGTDFYAKWTLFEVQDSALIKWVQEESCIGDDLQVKQFTLITVDEFIDIITLGDPDIEIL
ncbi:hypothetical protein [Selenomonas noxia]|jgi:putative uncharacterized protein (fragment)|uniref:hypothetical protein n=1 Tax=Selenomonas noxia TaxID=135083 RepID=UPI00248BA59D|nr:hypothetical protein [Selenomonas noxia]